MTTIVLVRHGETDLNRDRRFRGRLDVPLNAVGRGQAEACARRITDEWKPTGVYSSPLSRAVQTAQPIARGLGLSVQVDAAFADLDYGQWQGLTLDEARRRWPDLVEAWHKDAACVAPPGGESLLEVQSRAVAGLRAIVARREPTTLVVVAHDAVNRLLLLAALDAPLSAFARVGQATGAVNVIEASNGVLGVAKLNDTCHLR